MPTDGTFLVSVLGQLEWIDLTAATGSNWHCKYEFVTGTDWKVVSGIEAGVSQIANVAANGDKIVFNFPIEITFKSTNPFGWPQIIISVYSDTVLHGYGRLHVPLQPGPHSLEAPLSKPQPSTFLGYLGTFFGYQPELVKASLLATAAGNYLIRMSSHGSAHISLNILSKGLRELDYNVGVNKF